MRTGLHSGHTISTCKTSSGTPQVEQFGDTVNPLNA
ncbi:hypothetical protein K1T71_008390 [Dendrolimus kikuchii]|uniref:Uncharacterized protein n=1 Tax=Dendrolimus kikuchii TaxID=765133 RepID=A0ACC1CXA4_9NEOP|nr:hypothetical protein K1T71_008390 [Dendrolimus kikuchii]